MRLLTRVLLAGTALSSITFSTEGYEFSTHALLTREAYYASRLHTDSAALLEALGIASRAMDLGPQYVDMLRGHISARSIRPGLDPEFSRRKINAIASLGRSKLPSQSLVGWLMEGAVREDDVTVAAGVENTPQDDPGGNFDRVLNHFYDPSKDRALTLGIEWGDDAPSWATVGGGNAKENRFSLSFAKEALWRALTLTQLDVAGNVIPLAPPDAFVAKGELYTEAHRAAYWATTFRAIGAAAHLLQDMSQPQQTRNDAHSGLGCSSSSCIGGHASYYENYVEARATEARAFMLRERMFGLVGVVESFEPVTLKSVTLLGYPIPNLDSYEAYFSTARGVDSLTGKGLANFTNQAFFSSGTNLGSAAGDVYAMPPRSPSHPAFRVATLPNGTVANAAGVSVTGGMSLLRSDINDYYNRSAGDVTDVALTSYSAFDERMRAAGGYAFTLNHYNYDDQARILLPRAVAYSAGLLNRIFRTSLAISSPISGLIGISDQTACGISCSFRNIELQVKNPSITESMTQGIFVAVATFHQNRDYTRSLAGEPGGTGFGGFRARDQGESIVVSDPVASASLGAGALAPGQQQLFKFRFGSGIPIQATDLTVQVVFRGKLGSESDAVVVGSLNISEPTFTGFANITDYVWDAPTSKYKPVPLGRYTTTDDTLNIKLRFGSATAPVVASIPKLSAGQHAQIATLTDRTAKQTMYVESQSANWLNASPVPVDFQGAEFYSPPNSNVYDANMKVSLRRGVYRQNYYFWTLPADGLLFTCTPTDERCLQATLPALSPTNTVPWTITF